MDALTREVIEIANAVRRAGGEPEIEDLPRGNHYTRYCPIARALNFGAAMVPGIPEWNDQGYVRIENPAARDALLNAVPGARFEVRDYLGPRVVLPYDSPLDQFARRFDTPGSEYERTYYG